MADELKQLEPKTHSVASDRPKLKHVRLQGSSSYKIGIRGNKNKSWEQIHTPNILLI